MPQTARLLTASAEFVTLGFAMGNKNRSTKGKILEILRASDSPVSGSELASLGEITRTSVWKAIRGLECAGYEISATRAGYSLAKDLEDSIFPWEFGADESSFMHFSRTDSTMSEARKIAEEAVKPTQKKSMRIVTADSQTNGRGCGKHSWTTPTGSLAFTLILDEKIAAAESHRIVMASQVALVHILENLSGRAFFTRWPNDVWSETGKVAGILSEFHCSGGMCDWLNVGIGLNASGKPRLPSTDAAFQKRGIVSRKEILSSFISEFKLAIESAKENSSSLEEEWNRRCCDIGKEFLLSSGIRAKFKKINSLGFAEFDNGIFCPGKISFRKNSISTSQG